MTIPCQACGTRAHNIRTIHKKRLICWPCFSKELEKERGLFQNETSQELKVDAESFIIPGQSNAL
jgi:hypothetical protein